MIDDNHDTLRTDLKEMAERIAEIGDVVRDLVEVIREQMEEKNQPSPDPAD